MIRRFKDMLQRFQARGLINSPPPSLQPLQDRASPSSLRAAGRQPSFQQLIYRPESMPSPGSSPPPADDQCTRREDVRGGPAIAFDYIKKGLMLSTESIERARAENRTKLLREKKLILILDLDRTLVHTRSLHGSDGKVIYVPKQANCGGRDGPSRDLFMIFSSPYRLTKLRPFVRGFLEEASTIFELYLYTMGSRVYANYMARVLDPGMSYFCSRVICRDDCTRAMQKGLDVVLGDERMVVILDDKDVVWERSHRENLIQIPRYEFFSWIHPGEAAQRDDEAQSSGSGDENKESDDALKSALAVLKLVHQMFYDQEDAAGGDISSRDVRQVLKKMPQRGIFKMGATST